MAFGIKNLEEDVQRFKEDIEKAKAKYIEEYAEYLNIATDFENVEQKYDFLQEEVELIIKVFPEERESNLSVGAESIFAVSGVFDIIAGISYMVNRYNAWKLIKVLRKSDRVDDALKFFTKSGKLIKIAKMAEVGKAARIARIAKTAKIAQITGGAGFILAIAGGFMTLASELKRKEYLEEHRAELQQHLDEFNSIIDEANEDTKEIINAFLTYFNELGINVDGVFNDNLDGFFNESGAQKFDDPESGIVSQLREALNSAIRAIGELNASIGLANNVINFFTDQGQEGAGLIEQVAMFTGLPKELIQRLYVFKLRELGKNVQEATTLSGLSENLVKELYARGYLDDGKTVEETVELSGLTEDKVRRVFASKLLDDELNAENPDDVLDLTRIAEQAGLSEEIVREIRAQKLADLQTFSEEESEQLVA
jgi:hypothetical protein